MSETNLGLGQGFERIVSSSTEAINAMIDLRDDGKLTQKMVKDWLEKIPQGERMDASYELELGLALRIEDLPQE